MTSLASSHATSAGSIRVRHVGTHSPPWSMTGNTHKSLSFGVPSFNTTVLDFQHPPVPQQSNLPTEVNTVVVGYSAKLGSHRPPATQTNGVPTAADKWFK